MEALKSMKRRKELPIIVLCLILIMSCMVVPAWASEEKSDGEPLTVGIPRDRCPIFYIEEPSGEAVGIGVDLIRSAAAEAGYDVNFKFISEMNLKMALDNPDYDVIMPFGSAVDSQKGKKSIISENLLQTPFTLVTKGRKEIPSLNKITVGMLTSLSAGAETVKTRYPGIKINLYPEMEDCVRALRDGEVDALLHNSYVWSYVLQKPSYRDLKVQPTNMFSMDFKVGTIDDEKGREIIANLNKGIDKLSDIRKQAIVLKYTSRNLYTYDYADYFYEYDTVIVLAILLILALTIILWQKHRVTKLRQEEKMKQLIDYDSLTGIYSLSGFRKKAEELIRDNQDILYVIVYINIKDFKYINESLGRDEGDEFLRFLANKIRNVLSDVEAVARDSADRFVVLRTVRGDGKLLMEDQQALMAIGKFFTERGKGNQIRIGAGVYVLTPEDYHQLDIDKMIDCARVAESRLRETYRDGYEFYNPDQWERGKKIADITGNLSDALKNGEIRVWYQPQVDYEKKEIIGAEALCRWKHSKRGWLSPGEFIPILEDANLIFELDSFVWEKVCQDLQRWNNQGNHWAVSINLSRSDITDERNIPGYLFDLVNKYGLTVDQLKVEITETAYVEDMETLIKTTKKLRDFGFKVEIDDFGSGYSSLHMLKDVPVDKIKLDMEFLTETGNMDRTRIIVGHVISMVKALGMTVIAEGVETASQAEFLLSQGCTEMQGFYFYKPAESGMFPIRMHESEMQ